jgi:TP901 family phage tail tape measure protein
MKSNVLQTLIVLRAVDKASAGFRKTFGFANKQADAFARKQKDRADRYGNLAIGAGAVAASIGALLYKPTQLAVNFQQAIANVGAVSGATAGELVALGVAARKQGRETMFTATQSAEAMQYLAMAGLKADQTIAVLPGVLNLAAAGNLNLAETADIATNIMSAFGLEVTDMTRIGDVLTRTFTSSNSTLESVAATMKYVGPVAKLAGLELEEAAAMTGVLANAGIKGQMAGTSLRGMLLRLAGKTKPAAAALRELGINTVDSEGNLRNLVTVLGEMGVALDGMPTGKALDIIKTLFETEGTSGAGTLLTFAKDGGLAQYAKNIAGEGKGDKARTAKDVAAARLATASGSFDLFKSAVEDLSISLGDALLPALTELATSGAKGALALSNWTGANREATTTIVKVVAGVGGLAAALGATAIVISSVATIAATVGPPLMAAATALASVGGVISALGTGLVFIFGGVPLAVAAALVAVGGLIAYFSEDIQKYINPKLKSLFGVSEEQAAANQRKAVRFTPREAFLKAQEKERAAEKAGTGPLGTLMPTKAVPGAASGPKLAPVSKPAPGSQTSINYAPIINMPAGGAADKQSFRDMLREHAGEVERVMQRANANKQRLAF